MYKTKTRPGEKLETGIQGFHNDIPDDVLQNIVHSNPGRLRKMIDAVGACIEVSRFTLIFSPNKERQSLVSIDL